MLKSSITAQDACNLLNELLLLDYDCAKDLISYHQRCNDLVAKHETIQVRLYENEKFSRVGIVGILNGMFGIHENGMGAIYYEVENDKITRFKVYEDDNEKNN